MAIKVRRSKDEGPDDEEDNEQEPESTEATEADPFVRTSAETISWFTENRNLVIGGIIAVLVAAIGGYVAYSYVQSQKIEASTAASGAVQSFEKPVDGSPEISLIKRNSDIDSLETFESHDEKWNQIFEQASKAVDKHGGTAAASQARLLRGYAAVQLEKYDAAVESYEAYLDGEPAEDTLAFVHHGLAQAYGAQKKVDQAVSSLDKMVEANSDLKAYALYQKGIYHQHAGNSDKARDLYNQALEEDPESPHKVDINRRLALL